MTQAEDHREEFVKYRLEKSEEAYTAALILYKESQWNGAVNRLYYACFYAASALLLQRSIGAKSHGGVVGKFSESVMQSGEMTIDEFRVFSKLLGWRSKGDYSDMFDFTKEDLDGVLSPTRAFLNKVHSLCGEHTVPMKDKEIPGNL